MFGLFFLMVLNLEWWILSLEQGLISLKLEGYAGRAAGYKLSELQTKKGKIFFSEVTYFR